MDAPVYPPATSFVAPQPLPRAIAADTTSIAELRTIPWAWAIVNDEIARMDLRTGVPQIKPHLDNFSLRDFVQFGTISPADYERVATRLRAHGGTR